MSTARAVATNLRANVMADAEYRTGLFAHLWVTALRGVMAVGTIHILFEQAPVINGWTRYEVVMVYGVFMIASGVMELLIFPSLQALTDNIRTGKLDFSLIRPADAQVIEATQKFDVGELIPTFAGAGLVAVAAHRQGIDFELRTATTLAAVAAAGAVLLYAFHLIVATSAFWFVKMDMLMSQLHELFNISRWPLGLYPRSMELAASVLVPATLVTTVPVEVLAGRVSSTTLGMLLGVSVAMAVTARMFWLFAVKRYSGASA